MFDLECLMTYLYKKCLIIEKGIFGVPHIVKYYLLPRGIGLNLKMEESVNSFIFYLPKVQTRMECQPF